MAEKITTTEIRTAVQRARHDIHQAEQTIDLLRRTHLLDLDMLEEKQGQLEINPSPDPATLAAAALAIDPFLDESGALDIYVRATRRLASRERSEARANDEYEGYVPALWGEHTRRAIQLERRATLVEMRKSPPQEDLPTKETE